MFQLVEGATVERLPAWGQEIPVQVEVSLALELQWLHLPLAMP